jgi:2-oxoglutarate dehydrogenase E1 component
MNDVAIVRVEQLSPFPFDIVRDQADHYPNATIVWAQEEPVNMGAWSYVEPRLETALKHSTHHTSKRPVFSGRDPTGAVATGNKKQHEQEEYSLLSQALIGEARKPKKLQQGIPIW